MLTKPVTTIRNAAEQQVQCHTSTDQLMAEEIEVERLRAQEETYANLQQDVEDLHDLFAELSHNVHVTTLSKHHVLWLWSSNFSMNCVVCFVNPTVWFWRCMIRHSIKTAVCKGSWRNEFSDATQTQAEAVASVEQHVDEAAENVEQGERFLSKAARYGIETK